VHSPSGVELFNELQAGEEMLERLPCVFVRVVIALPVDQVEVGAARDLPSEDFFYLVDLAVRWDVLLFCHCK
jgi:hypothetical protein